MPSSSDDRGDDSALALFIYLGLFNIIIFFRLNYFIYLYIIYFYFKNDCKIIFF